MNDKLRREEYQKGKAIEPCYLAKDHGRRNVYNAMSKRCSAMASGARGEVDNLNFIRPSTESIY